MLVHRAKDWQEGGALTAWRRSGSENCSKKGMKPLRKACRPADIRLGGSDVPPSQPLQDGILNTIPSHHTMFSGQHVLVTASQIKCSDC